MGRYLILDKETKSAEQVVESLKTIDAQSPQFEAHLDLTAVEAHFTKLEGEAKDNFWTFDLIILDYGLYTPPEWPEKISQIKKMNKDAGTIIMVGYENKFTAQKFIRPLQIYNFIFKPFDALILKESLHLSTKICKKAQPIEMKSQTTTAFIALLKEVELQTISELGFVTLSDSQLEPGSAAKYFSPIFLHGKKQSTWAQCMISVPHPQKPGFFINKFQFIAAEQPLLLSIRKYVAAHKVETASNALWNLNPPPKVLALKLGIIGAEDEETASMIADLQNRYKNLSVEIVKIDPSQKADGKAIYDHDITLNMTDIKAESFQSFFKKECVHLWFTTTMPKEDDMKALAKEYRDIFVKPLDRSYFFKKLKIHVNGLAEKDQSHLINISSREVLKVANKVKISEISELYVNLVYSREMAIKDFREFVFISEDETQNVELPAFCHYTEKVASTGKDDPGGFFHQFVFFAMTDHQLKQIRLWLLHNYIVSNAKE